MNSILRKSLIIILGSLFTIILWYIDFEIITPMLLPGDFCYYHFHDIPWWIELFYMGMGSNGHPEGSMFHFLLIPVIGFFMSYKIVNTFTKSLTTTTNL